MFHLRGRVWRWVATVFIAVFLFLSLIVHPNPQTNKRPFTQNPGASAHDDDEGRKKGLSREQRTREAWVWHQANALRLERNDNPSAAALTAGVINNDINDISVIQGDGSLVTQPNPFDLNGVAVQFTPSGSGYTIAASSAAFDTNFGAKLDLTTAPAVNPKTNPVPDPGDDAYILQDLGFNFSFFGAGFSSVAVSSNGNLTFRPANVTQTAFDLGTVSSTESLAELQGGLPRIAPYWHDLDATTDQTTGANGVYLRRDSDRVLITWNNIRDFPNDPIVDRGLHRFQVSLFNNGRIVFTYASAELTSQALVGVSPGATQNTPVLIDLSNPPTNSIGNPIAEIFSTSTMVDYFGVVQAFYATHPNRDVYDFIYLVTDFDFDLGDAFAFYAGIRNDASGIGLAPFDFDPTGSLGSRKIQGLLNLSNISTNYPNSPVTRFFGANHALSIMGQEQGHRWLAYPGFPGNELLLLGRDDAHWSFFYSIESTISSPAAPRSSSAEGNVWVDNGNGTFTSVNLIDGFSRLDHYLMGLRPASDVPDTFVIANPFGTIRTRESNPRPNTIVSGTRQNVTINQIVQANNARNPDSTAAPKNFRAAVVLLVRQGTQPSEATLSKVTRYRLAWESYFSQSTDFLATINTGLADQTTSRVIAAASAASYKPTLSPGEIAALFGVGLTTGATEAAATQPLPTTLAGTQVFVNGTPASLFFASPNQINFQVPRTTAATTGVPLVPSATALIEVVSNGQLIRAGAFQIAPVTPAVFTLNASGAGAATAIDAFTFTPGPFNAKQANGDPNIIAVFGTGLGTDATDIDGDVSASVRATLDGNPVTVSYAGRAPGFTGLNQFNVVFPANIITGTHTLIISRNNIQSAAVTIAIR